MKNWKKKNPVPESDGGLSQLDFFYDFHKAAWGVNICRSAVSHVDM